jgi:hypothetical protein
MNVLCSTYWIISFTYRAYVSFNDFCLYDMHCNKNVKHVSEQMCIWKSSLLRRMQVNLLLQLICKLSFHLVTIQEFITWWSDIEQVSTMVFKKMLFFLCKSLQFIFARDLYTISRNNNYLRQHVKYSIS